MPMKKKTVSSADRELGAYVGLLSLLLTANAILPPWLPLRLLTGILAGMFAYFAYIIYRGHV